MKVKILLCCLTGLWFANCGELIKDKVKSSFPGIYIRYSEHEFGKEYDTLVISEQAKIFQILRKWQYARVLDGQARPPEYKQKITTAVYDMEMKLLNEIETGNIISYDPDKAVLLVGATKYEKIK